MKTYEKGEYGYLKRYRRNKLIGTIIFALMIIFIVVTIVIMFGDTKRVAIVFAILLALPLAKFIIAFILCVKFKSLSLEDYNLIRDKTGDSFKDILFDMSITQYEGMKFYPSMLIKNGKIYAYVNAKDYNLKKKDYEKWIKNAITDTKYEYKVFVTDNFETYIKKVNSVSTPNHNTKLIDKHITEQILEKGV